MFQCQDGFLNQIFIFDLLLEKGPGFLTKSNIIVITPVESVYIPIFLFARAWNILGKGSFVLIRPFSQRHTSKRQSRSGH